MLVVAVDESQKNARIRSRRVLSKYLPQVGSGTWMGHLSKEGIQEMREELSGKGSKNSAICCFAVRSSKRFEILWFVGSTSDWNDAGWFVYRSRAQEME